MFNLYVIVSSLFCMYLKVPVHRFAVMFAHALLLDLSKEVIVPNCIWHEADNLISLLSKRRISEPSRSLYVVVRPSVCLAA